MIDIILTTYNRKDLLKRTLSSVFERTGQTPYRLFVLDDCSTDGTQEYLANLNHGRLTHVILNKERRGVRYGFDALWASVREFDQFYERYPFMCYMQDDMEVMENDWLETLLNAYMELKDRHKVGFFTAYDCIEHPITESASWNGKTVYFKRSTGFPNAVAEKSFWESIGRVPRLNPDGRPAGFPSDGKGSNMDVWFTGCYSKSRFDHGAASKNCSYNQRKSVMVIPMMRHLAQVAGSTWAESRYKKKVMFIPEKTKQHESEIMALCEHIGSLRNVVEIGTYMGGTALLWASISSGRVITVDVETKDDLCFRETEHERRIHVVMGKSQSDETEARVREILAGEKADLLFIDGGHSYGEAEEDFERYSKYVVPGGWIALHDIKNMDSEIGVPAFWEKIKGDFESREFFIVEQPPEGQRTVWGLGERNERGDCNRNGIGLIKWRIPGEGRAVAFFTNGLGNFVEMMPALQAMASLTKDGKVDLCLDDHWNDYRRSAVEEICGAWPVIGKVLKHPKDKVNPNAYEHWFFSAHGMSNDVAPIFLFRMKHIVPKPRWRSDTTHEADHYMDIAYGAGYEGEPPAVRFPVADGPTLDLPRPLIGICNGYFRTSTHYWDKKGWPHFARLSEVLALYYGGSVIGLGLAGEIPGDTKLTEDYTGKLGILETAKVISQLDLLVTTDTGLMHIADIMGIPLIAMFGPTLTTKNAPRGKASHVLQAGLECVPCQDLAAFHRCKKNACMESILVGDAMAAARLKLMGHDRGYSTIR